MPQRLSPHRVLGAEIFNRLCALTGMTASDLCRHLGRSLGRDHELQPATLRAWRTGRQAVPADALLVIADLVKFRFPGIEVLLLGEQIDDEHRRYEAFAALVRRKTTKARRSAKS